MGLQLDNPVNWNQIYVNTFTRNYALDPKNPDFGYIGEIVIPVLFTSPYLTVKASTTTGKPNWRQFGYAKQKIRTVNEAVDTFINQPWLLSLQQPTLLAFDPNLSSSYALWFKPFRWFNDCTLNIYQYTGTS